MRVDALSKISQLYQANSTNKLKKTSSVSNPDYVEISQMGKDYQVAKQAVASSLDIREDKVSKIKSSIASGTYNVSSEELADKLIDNFFDSSI